MNAAAAQLTVFAGQRFACIRITGRATFNSSIDFKNLLSELSQRNYKCVVLDLEQCVLMDSTFLGVLAGFGLKMQRDIQGTPIELLNPSERIIELLENLGVLNLFRVTHGKSQVPGDCKPETLAEGNHTRLEKAQACMEAHETLMALSPENAGKFKDVAQFLAEDLKRLRDAAEGERTDPSQGQ